jgi:hypothetical protein
VDKPSLSLSVWLVFRIHISVAVLLSAAVGRSVVAQRTVLRTGGVLNYLSWNCTITALRGFWHYPACYRLF